MEHRLDGDHQLQRDTYDVKMVSEDQIVTEQMPALNAINMRLRDDYVKDASGGLTRWNKIMKRKNVDFEFQLPHELQPKYRGIRECQRRPARQHHRPDAGRRRWPNGCQQRPMVNSSSR